MRDRVLLLLAFSAMTIVATPAGFAAAQSPVAMPDGWLGKWEFTECWPGVNRIENDCIDYRLHISQVNGQTIADLDMDGFQTMSRIRGAVKQTKDGIRIVFVRIREPGIFDDAYKAGDVLLVLSAKDGKVLTTWVKMTPALDKNKKTGVRFEKVK